MKTIKSSLLLSILTIFALLFFSGCYTQLAFVADEPDSAIDYPSTIAEQVPTTVIIDQTIFMIDRSPTSSPLPVASSTSITNETHASSPARESGYRRPSSSQDRQTVDSNSDTRTSGSQHGRR
jgi:hypothetical protein